MAIKYDNWFKFNLNALARQIINRTVFDSCAP